MGEESSITKGNNIHEKTVILCIRYKENQGIKTLFGNITWAQVYDGVLSVIKVN